MKTSRKRTWSEYDLREGVSISYSISDVLRYLNLRVAGGNHKLVKSWIHEYNIDISHFNLNASKAALSKRVCKSKEEALCENSLVHKGVVKRWAKKLLPYICICGNNGWHNGKELVLQLDHINGISNDNRLENIRWLCPNCHSQTDTFAGKKVKST